MNITLWAALGAVLLAFPAQAGQDYKPWLNCVADHLSQRTFWVTPPSTTNPYLDIVNNDLAALAAREARNACIPLSHNTPSEDLEQISELIAHFRHLAAMPGAPPAFTGRRQ
jgi:ABC-type sugar transport system substrate-binding protein